jgi:FkbM family methyltransferase
MRSDETATLFEDRLGVVIDEVGALGTVVDIGAHVGALTLPALARGATVVAVEPCIVHMAALLIQANDVGAGTLLPVAAAIWDQGGRLFPLYGRSVGGLRADPGQLSLLPFRESQVVGWTATITLDELFQHIEPPQIDLLKIDVEGAEHRILPGTSLASLRRVRHLDLDNHDIRSDMFGQGLVKWADLDALLREAGFALQASGLWKREGG